MRYYAITEEFASVRQILPDLILKLHEQKNVRQLRKIIRDPEPDFRKLQSLLEGREDIQVYQDRMIFFNPWKQQESTVILHKDYIELCSCGEYPFISALQQIDQTGLLLKVLAKNP